MPLNVKKADPKSIKEAASKYSLKRIKTISKNAIVDYIDSFFNSEQHLNRRMLEGAVGKIQYFSDLSFTSSGQEAAIERPIQLARFMNNLKEQFPAILVIDAGARAKQYVGSRCMDLRTGNFITDLEYTVPVSISVASLDEETTDQISSILSLAFGPLLLLAGGSVLTGDNKKGHTWKVTLPNNYEWSALSASNVEGDAKDQIWYCTFDMELMYEDSLQIKLENIVTVSENLKQSIGKELGDTPVITFPDTFTINDTPVIRVQNLHIKDEIIIDNADIATFDPDTLKVTPRQIGSFKIMVVDKFRKVRAEKNTEVKIY